MTGKVTWLLGVALLFGLAAGENKMKEVFSWKNVDFDFPSAEVRQEAIGRKEFIQENNLPLGIEVWGDKVFVTVPRWKNGVPSTLNYVRRDGHSTQNLIPYPDWETNNITSKENGLAKVVNTFRIRADECDRLWVMDSGLSDILGSAEVVSPTKLVVFDLKTDKILRVYPLKATDVKEDSFFANVIVDITPGKCEDAFAYLPDLGSYGLVVYSWKDNTTYRVKHHYFHFDPLAGNYNIGGVNFQWTDGIFGIALSKIMDDGYRTMYFHPLSSTREFAVSTKIIQNETIASESYHDYHVLGSRGPDCQATASSMDEKSGVLFFNLVNKNGVGCWNSYKHPNDYSADTNGIVASDNETMIFPNDLKIDRDSNLWVITDKLPMFIYKGLNYDDVNFRILMAPVSEAIKGTVCDPDVK